MLQTLRHAMLPITIFVDNAGVVDGYAKGKAWRCHSGRAAADLWRQVCWKCEDFGGEGIVIEKVKGHATQADIDAGKTR